SAAEKEEAPSALFATVWGGLERFVEALAEVIGQERIATATSVRRIGSESGISGGYVMETSTGERIPADAVVLATPAYESARLTEPLAPGAAEPLRAIPYSWTA